MILKITKQSSINTVYFVSSFVLTENGKDRLYIRMQDNLGFSEALPEVTDEALEWLKINRVV